MEARWTSYKDTLRELYLVKDLTLKEIACKMEQTHNFKANAGQYERQFKKWGFRKNLAKNEWQLVSRSVEKRTREGKKSEIRIDGVQVPPKKLKKALSRYGQGTTLDRLERELREKREFRSPTPPRGVTFSPPPAMHPLSFLRHLPWWTFLASSHMWLQGRAELFQSLTASTNGQLRIAQTQFRAFLPELNNTEPFPLQQAWHSTGLSVLGFAIFLASNNCASSTTWDTSIISKQNRHLVAGLLQVIQNPDVASNLNLINAHHEPTADAILQLLFKATLKSGNVSLVRLLLTRFEVDVGELLPGPFSGQSPLEVAIESKNTQLVELLLDHGAQVNMVGPRGEDMLKIAARTGSDSMVCLLLPRFTGCVIPALIECLHWGRSVTANHLWEKIDPTVDLLDIGPLLLSAAAACGHLRNLNDMLGRGVDINTLGNANLTALQELVYRRGGSSLAAMKLLVDRGARVDYRCMEDGCRMPTALQLAVSNPGRPDIVEFLLRAGADPNAEPADQSFIRDQHHPALKTAMERMVDFKRQAFEDKESFRTVNLLLEYGAKLDEHSLADAVKLHQYDTYKLLLNYNAPPSIHLLFSAADTGNKEVLQLCLDNDLDVNHVRDNDTPLTSALRGPTVPPKRNISNYPAVYEMLLEKGASVNPPDVRQSPLALAIQYHRDLVPVLLSKGANCDDSRVLSAAVCTGDVALLEAILDMAAARPGFNAKFTTSCLGHLALYDATIRKDKRMVTVLIQKRINLASPCAFNVLQGPCHHDKADKSLMDQLLSRGLSPNFVDCYDMQTCTILTKYPYNDFKFQPLQVLARTGNNEMLRLLLSHGADPNLFGYDLMFTGYGPRQNSVLASAAIGGHLSSVNILLKAGAEVNQPALSEFERTPLQTAAEFGHSDIVERLLEAGADVNARPAENGGVTALQIAAINGYVGIAATLIEHGANVNASAAKKDGRTALEGACEHGRLDMVELLVRAGLNLRTATHERALKFAREEGFNAVARLLERHVENARMEEFFDFEN